MSSKNFIRLVLATAFAMTAVACDHDKLKARLPDMPPPPSKTSGCPEVEGIWGQMDESGKATPVAVFDKSEEGFFRFTDLEKYKESIVVGENAFELSRRQEVKESVGIRSTGMLFCQDGIVSTRFVESGPDSSLPERVTTKTWTLDPVSLTGSVETIWPDGKKVTETLVKVVIEDQVKE